jgi:hypothetical protein
MATADKTKGRRNSRGRFARGITRVVTHADAAFIKWRDTFYQFASHCPADRMPAVHNEHLLIGCRNVLIIQLNEEARQLVAAMEREGIEEYRFSSLIVHRDELTETPLCTSWPEGGQPS